MTLKEIKKKFDKFYDDWIDGNEEGSAIADFYEKEIILLLEEVEGEIKTKSYTDKDGDFEYGTIIDLEDVLQILKSKRNEK